MADEVARPEGAINVRGDEDEKAPRTQARGAAARTPWTRREKALAAVAGAAIAAAVAGFSLFAASAVPPGAAAKVDGFFISEEEVAGYIAQQRAHNGQADDGAFAQALLSQGLNPGTYRQGIVNQLALNALIDRRAEELGVAPSEADVDEQVDALKKSFAFENDDIWADTLSEQGTDPESVRKQLATNLAEQALYEKEVPKRTPTDDQVRAYMANARAGKTDIHSWRIVFKGDGAEERALECSAKLEKNGTMDAEAFSAAASASSDDEAASENGGDAGWAGDGEMTGDYADELYRLSDGEVSGPVTVDDADATMIIYRDESYTYPSKEKCEKADLGKLPQGLREQLADAEAQVLWKADCSAYLANLLGKSQITYYPMPLDAGYNVDMSSVPEQEGAQNGQ